MAMVKREEDTMGMPARKKHKGTSNAELNRTIKALVSQMSKDKGDQGPPGGDNPDQCNRNNPALTRQPHKKGR